MAAPSPTTANLSNPISNLTRNLEGLREFLVLVETFLQKEATDYQKAKATDLIPLVFALASSDLDGAPTLSETQETALKEKFGDEFSIEKDEGSRVKIKVTGESSRRFEEAIKGLSINKSHQELLYRNCLISLISSAEWFLSQVLRQFFESFPDAAGVKEKSLTLEDLRRIGTIAEAESYLISLRVDEIMWGGLDDWLKFLRNTVKLSMGYLSTSENSLVEVFQRRNVMVHNNGIVHHSYLAKVPEELRKNLKAGEKLEVTPQYLQSAIDTVEKSFLLIAAELWKKLDPTDEKRADVLNDITMKALFAERYEVAAGASRFQMEDKRLPEKWLLFGQLNFWQTEKWAGRFDEIKDDVEQADFSAKDDLIQLARYVLIDDFDKAVPLAIAAWRSGKFSLKDLEEWPIFKEFRKDDRVAALISIERAKASSTLLLTPEAGTLSEDAQTDEAEDSVKPTVN